MNCSLLCGEITRTLRKGRSCHDRSLRKIKITLRIIIPTRARFCREAWYICRRFILWNLAQAHLVDPQFITAISTEFDRLDRSHNGKLTKNQIFATEESKILNFLSLKIQKNWHKVDHGGCSAGGVGEHSPRIAANFLRKTSSSISILPRYVEET